MAIQQHRATTPSHKVHDLLHDMYDGENPVVAIEVFGPPEAMTYDKKEDADGGPWVLGPRDEAIAHAESTGYDWEIQYELAPPGED